MSDVLSDAHMYLSEPDETVLTAALRNKDDIPILMDIVGDDSESPISQEMHFKNSMFKDRMGQATEPDLEIESIGPATSHNNESESQSEIEGLRAESVRTQRGLDSAEVRVQQDRQAERERRAQTMAHKSAPSVEHSSDKSAADISNKPTQPSRTPTSSASVAASAQPVPRVARSDGHAETKPVVRKYVPTESQSTDSAKRTAPRVMHNGETVGQKSDAIGRQPNVQQNAPKAHTAEPAKVNSAEQSMAQTTSMISSELLASAIQTVLERKLPELIAEVMTEISKREKH